MPGARGRHGKALAGAHLLAQDGLLGQHAPLVLAVASPDLLSAQHTDERELLYSVVARSSSLIEDELRRLTGRLAPLGI